MSAIYYVLPGLSSRPYHLGLWLDAWNDVSALAIHKLRRRHQLGVPNWVKLGPPLHESYFLINSWYFYPFHSLHVGILVEVNYSWLHYSTFVALRGCICVVLLFLILSFISVVLDGLFRLRYGWNADPAPG